MIAYCGLNCARCDAYIATRENDENKRETTARNWSRLYQAEIGPEQINCDGCKPDGKKFFHCRKCEIRECCLSRRLENCVACDDYICGKLAEFIKIAPEAGRMLEQLRS